MAKKTNVVANEKNSIISTNVENVVINEVATTAKTEETLPLKDSQVITDSIEKGDEMTVKKSECMDLIKNHFRAPVPSAMLLFGRFFREGYYISDNNKQVTEAHVSLMASEIDLNDDSAVVAHIFSLSAPVALAVSRAANAWWRVAGDYISTDIETVIDFANNNTELPNEVYFCEVKKEWLFVDDNLVIYSASDADGAKNMLLPGCYYKVVERSTANYIRSIGSLTAFLKAKRREMNGKISNVFALAPAVREYIKKILLAGFLDANEIGQIAISVQKELDELDKNEILTLTNKIQQKEFEVTEYERQIKEIKDCLKDCGKAKAKKLRNELPQIEQKLSAARTSLKVAQIELEKLQK